MPLPFTTIAEAAQALRNGLTSPGELVEEAFNQIEARDGEIKAFVTLMREQALADVEMIEREQFTGFYRSPLHGIPVAIKDIIAVKDVRTTAGSRVLEQHISREDAMVVEQLRKAGAIIIGKTNTHEFAYGTFTPPTRNPWNLNRVPGGSSGGSAAALAAGMALGAVGSDTGGSIRIPAACCGVTGLKPTYGRVSCYGVIPLSWSLDHVGPMARTAEDCAILFDAIAGYDPRDPNSTSGPPSRTTASLINGPDGRRDQMSLQGLTLGVPSNEAVIPLDPEVRAAWAASLLVMKEEGAQVKEVEIPTASLELYRTIQRPEATLSHRDKGWLEHPSLYQESTLEHLMNGFQVSAVDYLEAQQRRRVFASGMRNVLQNQGIDALVLPTIPIPAIPVEQAGHLIEIDGISEESAPAMLRLTMPFNLSGLPTISFPCGFSKDNLPIGLQIAGRPFEESTVLRIAHAYQQLTDWHTRQP